MRNKVELLEDLSIRQWRRMYLVEAKRNKVMEGDLLKSEKENFRLRKQVARLPAHKR